ncbi:MAG: dTMP kinase [Dehalococcoidia bacterium]
MNNPEAGTLISIEGGDGAGKSTQAAHLVRRLKEAGLAAMHVREPGGTPLGEELRRLVKGAANPTGRAELLLFEAARAELVDRVIRPALERGEVVVTDRFSDSSLAYQGYGRGLGLDAIRALNAFATGGIMPGLTILLDMPGGEASARIASRDGAADAAARRFENESLEFHRRVADGYRQLAASEPGRWVVVNADRPEEEVAADIWRHVSRVLGLSAASS